MDNTEMNTTLSAYLNEISKYPLLSLDEEKQLVKQIEEGNIELKQKLINSNYRLVVSIAKKYTKDPKNLLDIIQNGNIGLMEAVDTYKLDKGTRFSTWADIYIRKEIRRQNEKTENIIKLPSHVYNLKYRYNRFINNYLKEFGKEPSDEEIIEKLEIDLEKLQLIKNLKNLDTSSLNAKTSDDEDDELINFINEDSQNIQKLTNYDTLDKKIDDKIILSKVKSSLSNYEYFIIYHRVLAVPTSTLEVVGEELGLTRERIRQLESKILRKLKKVVTKNYKYDGDYNIKEILETDYTPKSLKEIISLYNLKITTEELEYYILYNLDFSNRKTTYEDLSSKLSLPIEKLKEIEYQQLQKLNEIEKSININEYRKNNNNKELFNLDIEPNYQIINYDFIFNYFNNKTLEDIIEENEEYFNSLPNKQYELILKFFNHNKYQYSDYDLYYAEREINLRLLGFKKQKNLSKNILKEVYLNNKEKFTDKQQILADHFILNETSKEELKELYPEYNQAVRNTYESKIIDKIERIYFGIDTITYFPITKEMVKETLNDEKYIFTDDQRCLLSLYYGLIGKEFSLREISELIEEPYVKVHDIIGKAKVKVLKLSLNQTKNNVKKEKEKYAKYIEDSHYEMTDETRSILRMNIIEEKSYEEIAKLTNLSRIRISNIITPALRKLDGYRYGINTINIITESDIKEYFLNSSAAKNIDRNVIEMRYIKNMSSEQISKITKITNRNVNNMISSFSKYFYNYKCDIKIPYEAFEKEITCHITDSILTEEERKFLSYYVGVKSKYNETGDKLSKEKIINMLNINEGKYHHILFDSKLKIRKRICGYDKPQYGDISKEELETILKDKHIPIDDNKKELLKDIKGIDRTRALTNEEIMKKYSISKTFGITRMYQSAILCIKQYLNQEIEPRYLYEEDIKPILKYFSKFDRNIIEKIYKDNIPVTRIYEHIGLTKDSSMTNINRIKCNLDLILKNDPSAKKFDYIYAEEVLRKDDILIERDKELSIKIYEMFFGENEYNRTTAPEIKKELNLKQNPQTIMEIVYDVMVAVEKYKIGYRKPSEFTKEEVIKFYKEEKEKLTKTDISWIERNINDNKEECSKKNSYSNDVTLYKILKNSRELEFNFSENTKEETITILNDNQDISEKSRAIVKSYYDIYERDLLSEKDKKEIYGVLSQIYKKGKRKTKCIS